MIPFPSFKKAFSYETNFYLTSDTSRIGKLLAHYELYQLARDISGEIVECGVFRGISLTRFATFRELFGTTYSKRIVGFDTFATFPQTQHQQDTVFLADFLAVAGEASISVDQLHRAYRQKGIDANLELVAGNILDTVPQYVAQHPELKISLLHIDTDVYEPAQVIMEHLYPRVARGGVVIVDNYGTFPGETKAVDEYLKDSPVVLRKFPFALNGSYFIKP